MPYKFPGIRSSYTYFILVVPIVLLAFAVRFNYWQEQGQAPVYHGIVAYGGVTAEKLMQGCGLYVSPSEVDLVQQEQGKQGRLLDLESFPDNASCEQLVPYIRMPLYPLLLGLASQVTGAARYAPLQLFQLAIDALGVFLVFAIAYRCLSLPFSFLAALCYACFYPIVRLTVMALPDALTPIAILMMLYSAVALHHAVSRGARIWPMLALFIAGGVLGIYLTNTAQFVPLLFAVATLLIGSRRVRLRTAALFVLAQIAMLLCLLPWAIRNQPYVGKLGMTGNNSSTIWMQWWEGFGELPNPWGMKLDDLAYGAWLQARGAYTLPLTPEKVTREYLLNVVFSDPRFPAHAREVFKVRARRLVVMVPMYFVSPDALQRNPYDAPEQLFRWGLLLHIVALVGCGVLWRRNARTQALFLPVPLAYLVMFAFVTHLEDRYVVHGYAGFPILFAAGLSGLCGWGLWIIRVGRQRLYRPLAIATKRGQN